MRKVTQLAVVDPAICTGCRICTRVCPVLAITVVDRKAVVNNPACTGCGGCEQRCSFRAITMIERDDPYEIRFTWDESQTEAVNALCRKANFNPEQIVCYCTETRANEVAAAVLAGNDTPEKVSAATGIRTGCKIECVQPILRILDAAGIKPERPEGGYQWYGLTATVYDIPDSIREKYAGSGFDFDGDREIFDEVRDAGL
ncbi:MAG: 4Fe-4S binding protein [Bacillota bacterium]|nr:4Fe-4S binding protein [Bacillota bacterium]